MGGTILVKKKDGSQVRMTMAEFREYKKQGTDNKDQGTREEKIEPRVQSAEKTEVKVEPELEEKEIKIKKPNTKASAYLENKENIEIEDKIKGEVKEEQFKKQQDLSKPKTDPSSGGDSIVQSSPHELATTTPVKDIFVDEVIASQQVSKPHPKIDQPLAEVSPQAKKWSADDHKSLLEDDGRDVEDHEADSRLPDQKHDLFSRVMKNLSFSVPDELQSRIRSLVLSFVKDVRTPDQVRDYAVRPVEKGGLGFSEVQVVELIKILQLTNQGSAVTKRSGVIVEATPAVKTNIASSKILFSDNLVKQKNRQTMHDVKTSEKIEKPRPEMGSLGPIEELQGMNLEDFRRLSEDPAFAAETLLKKFTALKKESYPLFLKALKVWYASPLYLDYQNILSQTIDQGIELRQFFSSKKTRLNNDEFISLVEMMKNI